MDPEQTADLFSNDPDVQSGALAGMAGLFKSLTEHPGWAVYGAFVERLISAKAVESYSAPPDEANHHYTRGYLAGLADSIHSAENLALRGAQAIAADVEEEKPAKRQSHLSLSGRGGV